MAAAPATVEPSACTRICQGIKQGVNLAKQTAMSNDGIQKIGTFSTKIIELVGKIIGSLSESVSLFCKSLKGTVSELGVFEFFSTIHWWICEKASSWQQTASMVGFTVLGALGILSFLDSIKAINFTEFFSNLSSVPILGYVFSGLLALSSGFSLWDNVLKLNKTDAKIAELKVLQTELEQKHQKNRKTASASGLPRNRVELLARRERIHLQNIAKCKGDIESLERYRIKTIYSIALDIAKIVTSILIIIGLVFSVGALAATGIPLLAVGVAVAGFALYRFLYDKHHSDKISAASKLLEAA